MALRRPAHLERGRGDGLGNTGGYLGSELSVRSQASWTPAQEAFESEKVAGLQRRWFSMLIRATL